MAANTSIQWTDRTWNPVRGCSVISPGCVNCYAMKQAHRFSGKGKAYEGLTKQTKAGPQWTGVVRTVESALLEPLSWRKPSRVFVNSMSDLFHEDVPAEFILRVFDVMERAKRHTFQVLTKRPARMLDVLGGSSGAGLSAPPLPNVWLGVSVENQNYLERIGVLKDVPAAVRFVSFEPLLEDLGAVLLDGIHWAIVGGESGPKARPFDLAWARSIVEQCRAAGVPVFMKQVGALALGPQQTPETPWPDDARYGIPMLPGRAGSHYVLLTKDRKGGDQAEWPADLRVREYPQRVA